MGFDYTRSEWLLWYSQWNDMEWAVWCSARSKWTARSWMWFCSNYSPKSWAEWACEPFIKSSPVRVVTLKPRSVKESRL